MLKQLNAQIAAMALTIENLTTRITGLPDNTEASHPEPSFDIAPMATRTSRNEDDDSDPNEVRVHITEGYVRNRMTLPREIYVKSGRDSYDHPTRTVNDPKRSYVIVNGDKYPQTSNQGRSSKLPVSTFNVKGEGQTVVFSRVRGNQWTSKVVGKVGASAPVRKATPTAKPAVSLGNGVGGGSKSAIKSKAVVNPFAPKAQAKPASKAQATTSWPNALAQTVANVKANAKAGFYNENVRNLDEHDYRVYLQRTQHKAFKNAVKANGMTLRQGVTALRKACEA